MRGIRVKNIVRELSGEKIDIVRWHDDTRTFVTNALAPAKLRKVAVDEAMHTVRVLVDPDQLSLAIGKKGQNARLTAKLTGWKIDIQKEEEALGFVEKVAKAIADLAKVEGIGVQRAEALVHAGFLTVEGILAADIDDIAAIDGLSAEIANEIHVAAEAAYEKEHGPIVE
jgi:N utilization substance protein A